MSEFIKKLVVFVTFGGNCLLLFHESLGIYRGGTPKVEKIVFDITPFKSKIWTET